MTGGLEGPTEEVKNKFLSAACRRPENSDDKWCVSTTHRLEAGLQVKVNLQFGSC